MGFVIDASCALKLVLDDAGGPAYREWFRQQLALGASLVSCTLLPYEVGNVIRKRMPQLSVSEAAHATDRIVGRLRLARPASGRTFHHAQALTFYDASYLAMAEMLGDTLVTADSSLAQAAQADGVAVRCF